MKEEWLVLTAATSTVSNIVGAIAKERGVRTVGLVRGDEILARSRCRADFVLSVSRPTLVENILDITGGRRVNAVLDSVGGPLVAQLLRVLVPGGRIIAYGVQDEQAILVTNAMVVYSNLTWKGFGIDRWLSAQENDEIAAMFKEIWSFVRRGIIKLRVHSKYRLQDFRGALEANVARERKGKVILVSP